MVHCSNEKPTSEGSFLRYGSQRLLRLVALQMVALFLLGLLVNPFEPGNMSSVIQHAFISFFWSIANWMPICKLSNTVKNFSWEFYNKNSKSYYTNSFDMTLEIPRISIPNLLGRFKTNKEEGGFKRPPSFAEFVRTYVEETNGQDWRERPLLLEGILDSANSAHLSLNGLLDLDDLVVPYFEAAYEAGALTPTAEAPVSQIVRGMLDGKPYKIGSQLIVQEHPDWLQELTSLSESHLDDDNENKTAEKSLLTRLFGNHFDQAHLKPGRLIPATTTVPVFVATGHSSSVFNNHTHTGLHCEPIGNVAFQIEGAKEWTLVDPRYSARLQPSLAADGRAFFFSSLSVPNNKASMSEVLTERRIPHWTVVTKASDALWVPTWTWHRVDYKQSQHQEKQQCIGTTYDESTCSSALASVDIAIGGSIFHFRPWDFLRRNPLFAALIVPALVKELAGISTQ
eukprot:scaffold2642_cov120-Cylindrotheca_fusiformis.AAC.13